MNMKLKIAFAAAFASLAGMSSVANATDIRLVNMSDTAVHPWFRSSCFAAPNPKDVWLNFGNVLAFSQFTWPQFELMMEPSCKRPTVDFTYNVGTMLPPLDDLPKELVARVKLSSDPNIVGVYVLQAPVVSTGKKDDDDD